MALVLITGSNDGLGRDAARRLVDDGHRVVGHARNTEKADGLRRELPGLADVLVADLSSAAQVRRLAEEADAIGTFDAVIHNAGLGFREPDRGPTEDGHARTLAVNALAPYLLTALMHPAGRLVYLTSGLHEQGETDLDDLDWTARPWDGRQAYCDSKLFDATLAAAIARRRPDIVSTSVTPGLGGDEDGRRERAGRPRRRLDHPGLARRLGRPGGAAQRRALLPPGAAPRPPGGRRRGLPGGSPRRLRAAHRRLDALTLRRSRTHRPRSPLRRSTRPWPAGSQHVACASAAQQSVSGLRARTMADPAFSWTRCVSRDVDVGQAGGGERGDELVAGERAGDAAGVGGHVGLRGRVHVGVGDHVGDGEAPAGLEDARGLARAPAPCRRRG